MPEDHGAVAVEHEPEGLAATAHFADGPTSQGRLDDAWGVPGEDERIANDLDPRDALADQHALHQTTDGLDLGELGHGDPLSRFL